MLDTKRRLAAKLLPSDVEERCGFVTKLGRIIEVKNIHPEPTKGFRIDPTETIKALKKGYPATWHTHPSTDPNLSEDDYNCFCTWNSMVHYIVGRRDGKVVVTEFRVDDGVLIQE